LIVAGWIGKVPLVDDPVFLVTGASGGIGSATARLAASSGYRLVLASRDTARLDALARELGGPERVLATSCDVTEWAQVRALVEQVEQAFGRLDVAFANAGQFGGPALLDPDVDADSAADAWRSMILTNVFGVAVTVRAVWPLLVRARGHLVLTGSVAGRVTMPESIYSATKWAVTGLGQSIRAAAVGSAVHVTVVQPGLVDAGPIPPNRRNDPKLDPADVARAVLFAVTQPPGVDVSEIVVRPTGQHPAR
jgi:NADP-dependent 3-hydroxy acid dehydrogenase YdfG